MSTQLEEERKQYGEQVEIVTASLREDPGNAELLALKEELEQMLALIDESLRELQPKQTAAPKEQQQLPPPPAAAEEKWSRGRHPALNNKTAATAGEEREKDREGDAAPPPASYKVNDNVVAKWVTGDKGFYPARITSVTGSSTNPVYTVKFKSYDTVETLRARDIRPVAQKRKADGTPANNNVHTTNSPVGNVAAPAPTASLLSPGASSLLSPAVAGGAVAGMANLSSAPSSAGGYGGAVTSAEAALYPQAQAPADASANKPADDLAKPKPKKIKARKELEAGKNKWQEFSAKGKVAKSHKKDSMFRTPEGAQGRVGFIGSGQAMRKDPTRSRHIYQPNEEQD